MDYPILVSRRHSFPSKFKQPKVPIKKLLFSLNITANGKNYIR